MHEVKTVVYGGYELVVVCLKKGEYAISKVSVSNIWVNAKQKHKSYLDSFLVEHSITPRGCDREVITLESFRRLTNNLNKIGDPKAEAIIEASFADSLERAFDRAFNNKVSEAEREARLAARIQGIDTRNNLEDSIDAYYDRADKDKTNMSHTIRNTTDRIYRALFGQSAKQLKAGLSTKNIRELLTSDGLEMLAKVEKLVKRKIDRGTKASDAVKEALAELNISEPNMSWLIDTHEVNLSN